MLWYTNFASLKNMQDKISLGLCSNRLNHYATILQHSEQLCRREE